MEKGAETNGFWIQKRFVEYRKRYSSVFNIGQRKLNETALVPKVRGYDEGI